MFAVEKKAPLAPWCYMYLPDMNVSTTEIFFWLPFIILYYRNFIRTLYFTACMFLCDFCTMLNHQKWTYDHDKDWFNFYYVSWYVFGINNNSQNWCFHHVDFRTMSLLCTAQTNKCWVISLSSPLATRFLSRFLLKKRLWKGRKLQKRPLLVSDRKYFKIQKRITHNAQFKPF